MYKRLNIDSSIVQIIRCKKIINSNKCNTTTFEPIGTGFMINSKGYFITARHNIFSNNDEHLNNIQIKDYRIILDKTRYTFREIDSLSYSKNEIDMVVFKINNKYNETQFIPIKEVDEKSVMGSVTIKGYPHSRDYTKTRELYINSYNNNRYELSHDGIEQDDIQVGCSGSPVYKEENGEIIIVGIMSFINNGKYYISSINLITKLFYTSINKALEYNFVDNSFSLQTTKRISISNTCKEISKKTQDRLSNPNIFHLIFNKLHEKVEHRLIRIEKNLDREYRRYIKASYTNSIEQKREQEEFENELRYAIQYLLKGFKEVFNVICGDVSINFKLIDDVSSDNQKAYFKTYTRVKAERELEFPRSSSEIFEVTNEFDINKLVSTDNFYTNGIRVNSGYNHAVCGVSRYYICNNLEKATNEKEYFSSSKDFSQYYNSLAIFVVSEKIDDHEINIIPRIKGLLIIDNIDEGSFEKKTIKDIGGYLSHKLDRLLSRKYYHILFNI